MNTKTALILALAAGPAVALAQSSVTLYGRVNTTVESQQVGDGSRATVMQNNSSRWGMRGSEDLGGGMKASFNLESGFSSANGTTGSALFGRAANVQLTGGFGAVRLGTWFNGSYFALADYISNHNHDTGTSSDALFSFEIFGATSNHKVAYFTPTVNGWNAELSTHLGQKVRGNAVDLAVNYVGGPLHLGFGYGKRERFGTTPEVEHMGARVFYELGGGLAAGAYVQREDINGRTRNIYRVAGMLTRGASEFHLNYGSTDSQSGTSNTGANQFTVAYNYNLSKRSKIYAFYTQVDNQSAATYFTGVRGADFNSVAVGVRHNF